MDHLSRQPDKGAATARVARLTNRLPRRSEVRHLAQRYRVARSLSDGDVDTLLAVVASPSDRRWKERVVAISLLGSMQHDAQTARRVGERLAVVIDWQRRAQTRPAEHDPDLDRLGAAAIRSLALAVVGALFLATNRPEHLDLRALVGYAGVTFYISLFVAPIVVPASMVLDTWRVNSVRVAAAQALGGLRAAEQVSSLAAAVFERSPRVREAARDALLRVLPAVRRQQYGELPDDTVPRLCRLLRQQDEQTVLAVLEALGQIGDGRAVGPVAACTKGPGLSSAVREAAQRVLPILERRRDEERNQQVLLRPAAAPLSPPEVLLRPAQGGHEIDPDLLLRPPSGPGGH